MRPILIVITLVACFFLWDGYSTKEYIRQQWDTDTGRQWPICRPVISVESTHSLATATFRRPLSLHRRSVSLALAPS